MLALLALGLAGCEPAQPLAAPPPAPAVTVAKPTKRLVAEQDEYVGRFVAVDASRSAHAYRATWMPSTSRTASS